jgi:hypothetical protein
VDPNRFEASFQPLRDFAPSCVLSTHLPPVTADTGRLFDTLRGAPHGERFVGPNQVALEAMLREFEPV